MKLVWDKAPTEDNGRNSEGSFIRIPDGSIMFAYSRYASKDSNDHAVCDIAAIYSKDEGESWSEPVIIAKSSEYGVKNIMSVSAIYQKDGSIGVYYIIKENDSSSTLGRAISKDGYTFTQYRCEINGQKAYYVLNNDRIIRLSDGRLAAPLAMHNYQPIDTYAISVVMLSDDDGNSFYPTTIKAAIPRIRDRDCGMQEPGIIEHKDGTIRLWARTRRGFQYEVYTRDCFNTCTEPSPSVFTSQCSPMEMLRDESDGTIYAVYNPVPEYMYKTKHYTGVNMGRTPFVIRKSTDDGRSWSDYTIIEDEKDRGYCYGAMFITKDGHLLVGYCRGNEKDVLCLSRLGIMKIALSEI